MSTDTASGTPETTTPATLPKGKQSKAKPAAAKTTASATTTKTAAVKATKSVAPPPTVLTAKAAQRAAAGMKLASDPGRILILSILSAAETNVTDLCGAMRVSQPAASHHLALLRVGGLIEPRRAGKCIYYSLTNRGKMLAAIAGKLAVGEHD